MLVRTLGLLVALPFGATATLIGMAGAEARLLGTNVVTETVLEPAWRAGVRLHRHAVGLRLDPLSRAIWTPVRGNRDPQGDRVDLTAFFGDVPPNELKDVLAAHGFAPREAPIWDGKWSDVPREVERRWYGRRTTALFCDYYFAVRVLPASAGVTTAPRIAGTLEGAACP